MDTTKKTLGQYIKEKRGELGVREFARRVKVDHTTIMRIEDKNVADPIILKRISEVLHVDYNELLALNGTIDDQPEVREIARASNKMSSEKKAEMMELLRTRFPEAFSVGYIPDLPDENPND